MWQRLWQLLRSEGGFGRISVGAAMVIALGGGLGAYYVTQGGAPAGTAHIWIDQNGGACIRTAPTTYSSPGTGDTNSCSSLNAAYSAANAYSEASTVLVKAGTYTGEATCATTRFGDRATFKITGDRTGPNRITFGEASGESVILNSEILLGGTCNGLSTDAPDYLTLKGFAIPIGITTHGDASHVTLDGVDGGAFSWWGGDNYVIINSDWGPCGSVQSPSFLNDQQCSAQFSNNNASNEHYSGGGAGAIDGIYFENNVVHDYVLYAVGDHYECWRADGDTPTTNMIVKNNWFYNCQLEAITGTEIGNGSIFQNNWVSSNEPDFGCDPFTTTCNGGAARNQSFGCPNGGGTVIYRYNSALTSPLPDDSGGGNCTGTDIQVYGNIMSDDWANGCPGSGVTMSYNVYVSSGSTCGGTGEISMAGDPYVNNSTFASANWHLASGASAPNNLVPTSTACTGLTDWDLQTRPINSNCDAGSDERDN